MLFLLLIPLPVFLLPQSQANQSGGKREQGRGGVGEAPFPKLVSKLQLFSKFSHHFILKSYFPSDYTALEVYKNVSVSPHWPQEGARPPFFFFF